MSAHQLATEVLPRWRHIHDRVFSGRQIHDFPFRAQDWKMALLPGGLLLDEVDIAGLRSASGHVSDGAIVLMDGEGEWANEPPLFVDITRECLSAVGATTVFGHTICHVFGSSAAWGLAVSPETFGVLGGTEAFMEAFVREVGGSESLHDRFTESAHEIGFGEEGRNYVAALLRMVGWS